MAALLSCITLYEISIRQTKDLPVVSLFPHPASFRFHLTMDTLAFGYILPTTGRIRDFNPLETCAAGRTIKRFATTKKLRTFDSRLMTYLKLHYRLQRSVLLTYLIINKNISIFIKINRMLTFFI